MAIFSSFEELEIEGESNGGIVLREEQKEAIKRAAEHFRGESAHRKFLWNAKMRFGKTICAMHLAKQMGIKACLIVTHRPVVNQGWREDFHKTFGDHQDYKYGTLSQNQHEGDFYQLENFAKQEGKHLVFFVSMQYLCLSPEVNTNAGNPNNDNNRLKAAILKKEWDLVVIDEAHEGTRTSLGLRVIDMLSKPKTKVLHLSGTPFNLYQDFGPGEIYTWDYIKEQRAKKECNSDSWKAANPGKRNPYAGLPRMNIFTYDLAKLLNGYRDEEQSFKFSEFFRTWNNKHDKGKIPEGRAGRFKREEHVNNFLNLLCKIDDHSGYPFSTEEYRNNFRHTLWVVPGVREAKALAELLVNHEIFGNFKVINVAGNSEDDETRANALDTVLVAIGPDPTQDYTITISCGRLTTGVTVPPWTAVLYLKGSDNTAASTYLQTIFRVQSPWDFKHEGKRWMKKECFVFDFAPNRTLQMMAETAKFSVDTEDEEEKTKKKKGKGPSTKDDHEKMEELLNFCPVVSMEGGKMIKLEVKNLFAALDRVYIDRVVRNGFNDNSLYNKEELLKLDPDALNRLREIIIKTSNLTKPAEKANKFELTNNPQNAAQTNSSGGGGSNMTDEEDPKKQEEKEQKKKEKEERDKRITILRGISLRIPLLIYGAELSDESAGITIDNFTSKIDDASWAEFMPRGISKEDFNSFKSAYNPTVFLESGKRIRAMAREADEMPTDLRIQRIAEIFSWFHNPDKETVLTPWRVVNMHMSDCIGGFCFFNENFDGPNQKESIDETTGETKFNDTYEPRFVSRGDVTTEIFAGRDPETLNLNSKILEINSKTGLYPLYVAYSLFRFRCANFVEANLIKNPENLSIEEEQVIWDDIIRDNIFVICNTPMAKAITKRTLLGFRRNGVDDKLEPNIKSEKLIEQATSNKPELITNIKTLGYWIDNENNDEQMEFNAIVGNPPYQMNDGSGASDDAANPIYQNFVRISKQINPKYFSLIMPSKWMVGGKAILKSFRKEMMEDNHLSKMFDYEESAECFTNQHIDGGICYFLWDKGHSKDITYFYKPINSTGFSTTRTLADGNSDIVIRDNRRQSIIEKTKSGNIFFEIVSARKPFGISTDLFNKKESYSEYNLKNEEFKDSVLVWGVEGIKGGAKRVSGYINESSIKKNRDWIPHYKLFISKAFSANAVNPPDLIVAEPKVVCTETFLVIGPFTNKYSLESVHLYTKTNFFRILLFFGRGTMQVSQDVFRFIPLQDFTSESDIDWNKSISDINNQLYLKYSFSNEEILFIESMIKPMK